MKENPSASPNLDFLRAVAITAVLVQHLGQQVTGADCFQSLGRAGVLLFFVHTSLVLMFSLERLEDRGVTSTIAFYVQRAFRIYPLCWFFIGLALVLHVPQSHLGATFRWQGWGWVIANVLLVQNITRTPFVLEQLWSLPYEVQMYIALPILHRVARRRDGLMWISLAWACSVIAALLARRWQLAHNGEAYVQMFRGSLVAFVPCFMGGILAFVCFRRKRLQLPPLALIVVVGGFLLGYAFLPIRHSEWFLCPLLGIALPQVAELAVRFVASASEVIARYSYGVYLSHVPLLWLCFTKLQGVPLVTRWIIFGCTLALVSVLGYNWIEKPMMEWGRLIARRWKYTRQVQPELAVTPG